jgi:hypothetical protein
MNAHKSSNSDTPLSAHADDLKIASNLAALGMPVFTCKLDKEGAPVGAFGWERTDPNPAAAYGWKKGQGLGAVTGHTFDVLDVDPRNGGQESYDDLVKELGDDYPTVYGRSRTASGGFHELIAPLGIRKVINFRPGLDLLSGDSRGKGRGFVFLAPTVRPSKDSKNLGELVAYGWELIPDAKPPLSDKSGDKLRQLALNSGGKKEHKDNGTGSIAYKKLCTILDEKGFARRGSNYQCPAHDDENPSLEVTDNGHKAGIHCHAGCPGHLVLDAIGLDYSDLYDDKKEGKAAQEATEAKESTPGRLKLVSFSDIAFHKVKWAWDTTADNEPKESGGRFPVGTICIGAGRPGAGKGQFACWLGAQISKGELPGCFYGKPKGVIFYSTEDSAEMTIGPRLASAGADLAKVFVIKREAEDVSGVAIMKLKEDLQDLRELIAEHDIGLVILDPLISILDGKTDVNSETAVRSELEPFQALLETVNCFAFGIMHYRKMKDEDILNMFSGSGAFPRVVRACIAFGAEKDSDGNLTRVISTVKNNLGRTDLPSYMYDFEDSVVMCEEGPARVSHLVFTGEAEKSVEDLNNGSDHGDKRTKLDKAASWLTKQLQGGPVFKTDVKAQYDKENEGIDAPDREFSWKTVERASDERLHVDTKKGFGGLATWSLPHVGETGETGENGETVSASFPKTSQSRQYSQKLYAGEVGETANSGETGPSQFPQAAPISPRVARLADSLAGV